MKLYGILFCHISLKCFRRCPQARYDRDLQLKEVMRVLQHNSDAIRTDLGCNEVLK